MFDYDYIMDGDWSHRVTLFDALPATEKAEIVRTHLRRWLGANRHRLSAEQVNLIEEQIAFVRRELYRRPLTSSRRQPSGVPEDATLAATGNELEQRARSLFSREDLYHLTLHGDRIPA